MLKITQNASVMQINFLFTSEHKSLNTKKVITKLHYIKKKSQNKQFPACFQYNLVLMFIYYGDKHTDNKVNQ